MQDPTLKNEFALKLTGKAFLPEKLEIGRNYELRSSGTITTCVETDKNDGTHLFTYKFEPVTIIVVNDLGERIKANDTRGDSQLFRSALWSKWKNAQTPLNFEDWKHELYMNLLKSLDEVVEMYQPI